MNKYKVTNTSKEKIESFFGLVWTPCETQEVTEASLASLKREPSIAGMIRRGRLRVSEPIPEAPPKPAKKQAAPKPPVADDAEEKTPETE